MERSPHGSLVSHLITLSSDEALAYKVFKGATSGIKAIHKHNRLHGDIKAPNLLVFNQWEVKWCDFGLGVLLPLAKPQKTGTPIYMAPEVLTDGMVSKPSDVYSLGLLFLAVQLGIEPGPHLVTEREAIAFTSLERRTDIPTPLNKNKLIQMIEWCTSFNPLDRPTAAELLIELKKPPYRLIDEKRFRKTRVVRKVVNEIRAICKPFLLLNRLIREHILKVKNNRVRVNFDITLPPALEMDVDQIGYFSDLCAVLFRITEYTLLDMKGSFGNCLKVIFWLKLHSSELHKLFSDQDRAALTSLLNAIDGILHSIEKLNKLNTYLRDPSRWPSLQFILPGNFLSKLDEFDLAGRILIRIFHFIGEIESRNNFHFSSTARRLESERIASCLLELATEPTRIELLTAEDILDFVDEEAASATPSLGDADGTAVRAETESPIHQPGLLGVFGGRVERQTAPPPGPSSPYFGPH